MPGYEYSAPVTFGSVGDGDFKITSPWNTPCEVAFLAVSFGKAGGGYHINFNGGSSDGMNVTETVAPNAGGAPGLYMYESGSSVRLGSPLFFPFPQAGAIAHWHPITTGEAGTITFIFRRSAEVQVPEMPVMPHVAVEDEHQYHLMRQLEQQEGQGR